MKMRIVAMLMSLSAGLALPGAAMAQNAVQSADRNGVLTITGDTHPRVPAGYAKAWDDDRLNPRRGMQTLNGSLQMALIWTQQVPRRLVDRNSGADMTEKLGYLVFPYTDFNTQLADLRAGSHVMIQNGQGEVMIVERSALRVSPSGVVTVAAPGQ